MAVYSDKRFLTFTGGWWLLFIFIGTAAIRQLGADYNHALTDAISSILLLAGFCFVLISSMKYYLPQGEKYWYILFSSLIISVAWLFLESSFIGLFFPGDDYYNLIFRSTFSIRLGAGFLLSGCLTAIALLTFSRREQEERLQRQEESKRLVKEAELYKLRQQLQPHFLFNSLNSIGALTSRDPAKAREMIQQLSEFLRGMLKKDGEKKVRLEEELHYICLYLEIEKVRFGDRLQTIIECDNESKAGLLPPMILQPLIENAIKFSLYNMIGKVLIKINAHATENYLNLRIENPFDSETETIPVGTGFGLDSIRRRLYLLFGRTDLLETFQEGNKFTTQIRIPQI